jgi:elongator complex protein 3
VLLEIKKRVPPYVRINRLIRDIPGNDIVAGNRVTNLRQKLQEQGADCRCIRCREARGRKIALHDAHLLVRSYPSSGGNEHFISFESADNKIIYAFVRLFLASQDIQIFGKKTAFVRELHTYGELMPIGSGKRAVQHIGFGKRLLHEAEVRAREAGYAQLAVISGIGVKQYYRNLGYEDSDTYMVKSLV